MNTLSKFIVVCGIMLSLAACQNNPTSSLAIQKPNQQFEVIGEGKSQLIAQNNAVKAAQSTCRNKQPIIVKNDSKYQGALSEDTSKVVEQAGAVVGAVFGKSISIARDSDYRVTLTFTCQ